MHWCCESRLGWWVAMVDRLHWTPERRSINQSPIDVVDVVIAIAREKEWEDKRKERLTSTRLKSRNSIANNVAASMLLANSLSLQSHSCRILSASQSQRGDSRRRKRKRTHPPRQRLSSLNKQSRCRSRRRAPQRKLRRDKSSRSSFRHTGRR